MTTPADQGIAAGRRDANQTRVDAAYEDTAARALEIAERLAERIRENWPAPDSDGINWTTVGSMEYITSRLAAVEKCILGTEE